MQQPDRQVVDYQSYGGNAQKAEVLSRNVRILVVESPDPVQDVIRRRGAEKAERIGDVLVEPQPLLAEVGDSEIDEDARTAHDAEFEKLLDHRATSVRRGFPLNQFVYPSRRRAKPASKSVPASCRGTTNATSRRISSSAGIRKRSPVSNSSTRNRPCFQSMTSDISPPKSIL